MPGHFVHIMIVPIALPQFLWPTLVDPQHRELWRRQSRQGQQGILYVLGYLILSSTREHDCRRYVASFRISAYMQPQSQVAFERFYRASIEDFAIMVWGASHLTVPLGVLSHLGALWGVVLTGDIIYRPGGQAVTVMGPDVEVRTEDVPDCDGFFAALYQASNSTTVVHPWWSQPASAMNALTGGLFYEVHVFQDYGSSRGACHACYVSSGFMRQRRPGHYCRFELYGLADAEHWMHCASVSGPRDYFAPQWVDPRSSSASL